MELRAYWQIVWRRRQVIVPLVLVTFIASAIANLILPPTYKAETMVLLQAIMPPPAPNPYYSEEYYRTVQSEYATDDLGMVVRTQSFAEKIVQEIDSRYGKEEDVRDVKDAIINAKKQHRTLKITVASGSYALTKRISEAIDNVLTREGGRLVSRPDRQLVDVLVIDPPRDPTSPSVLRRLLDVLLHSAVALVVGVGLAFLLHALDDRVQSEADAAETAGWPVIGAIPVMGGPQAPSGPFSWVDGMLPRLRRPGRNGRAPATIALRAPDRPAASAAP
jgi:capsular polysaccharide biosynthesis protein